MIIEPTDAMGDAYGAAYAEARTRGVEAPAAEREALSAVFALLEQDYQITRLCREELAPGLRCVYVAGPAHPSQHRTVGQSGCKVAWS